VRGAKNPHKHHPLDYSVAEAVKVIEDSRCPKCGVLAWHAYSTDSYIEFECEDVTCQACAHKEEAEEKEKDKRPGTTKVVRAKNAIEGEPLPGRLDFFKRLQQEAEIKARHEAERQD
jgi:hypothetical protein